jgi:hypothetical protein
VLGLEHKLPWQTQTGSIKCMAALRHADPHKYDTPWQPTP